MKEFEYLDHIGYEYPQLVLGTKFINFQYNFKSDRKWIKIVHQTAGLGCHQHYIIGTILTIKEGVRDKLKIICDNWYNSNAGFDDLLLDWLFQYRKDLKELLQVDCNSRDTYSNFEEAIYPIDLIQENINKLTIDILPDDLNILIEQDSSFNTLYFKHRLSLFILGQNSD